MQSPLYLHIGKKMEVSCSVTNGKVVLDHSGFGSVEAHLVPSEPSLIADNTGSVNCWTRKVEVNVAADVNVLTLVSSLDFAAFFAVNDKETVSKTQKREIVLSLGL